VPIEVRRFGVGHRRPDGPPGTTGIAGQVIESGSAGTIAELAFERRARITPHTNPNWSYFLVIEGGGWVGVGNERTRIPIPDGPTPVIWTTASPERIPTNILAERLERLLAHRIIEQIPAEDGTKRLAYGLTEKGKALGAVLKAMRDWGLAWDKSTRVMA